MRLSNLQDSLHPKDPQAEGVVVVELGQQARSPQEASSQLYFSRSVIKSLLLVTSHSPARQNSCPMPGRYLLSHPPSLLSLHHSYANRDHDYPDSLNWHLAVSVQDNRRGE